MTIGSIKNIQLVQEYIYLNENTKSVGKVTAVDFKLWKKNNILNHLINTGHNLIMTVLSKIQFYS